ncbi:MAG TPA: cupin domain-containing protein [Bacteroidales bacterium]|nr:cupin domain-containing protein [Bacteroidales bacterium]
MSAEAFVHSTIYNLKDSVSYSENSIVSKVIAKSENVNLTLFAFDAGQNLSKHTSPFDAMIQVLEGKVQIEIGDDRYDLEEGKMIIMPANVPHAVEAADRFKMLLIMFRI